MDPTASLGGPLTAIYRMIILAVERLIPGDAFITIWGSCVKIPLEIRISIGEEVSSADRIPELPEIHFGCD